MQDLIYVAVTIAFFVMAITYVYFCERMKWGELYERWIDHHAGSECVNHVVPDLRAVASGEIL